MINPKDTNLKAVPYNKDLINKFDKQMYYGSHTYPAALVKKLKAIAEQQLIGNR